MKKIIYAICLAMVLTVGTSGIAFSSSGYLTQFNTKYGTSGTVLNTCSLCHPGGNTGAFNSFANDFASGSIGNHTFNTTLENRDSDGDGYTNIIEINARTFPGNANSKPSGPADTTPPTVSFSIGSFLTPRKVSITCTATDNAGGSGVARYMVKLSPTPPPKSSLNWKAASPTVFIFPLTSTTGPKTLYAFAKDKAGNVSASASAPVNLDVTKPTLTAFSAQATSPASGTVTISVTATDPIVNGVASGVTSYMITRSNLVPPSRTSPKWISGPTPPTSATFLATIKPGAKLYAWVKDANGNISKPKGTKVTASVAAAVPQQAQPTAAIVQPSQKTQTTGALSAQLSAPLSTTTPGPSQMTTPDTPADMTIWLGKWFKISIKNMGFYNGKSGLTTDRQNISGYLKIRDWDPNQQVFQSDLYEYNSQTNQWAGEMIVLHYLSGNELDLKVWSQIAGEVIYAFTARIQGQEMAGELTSATIRTQGGYHIQENVDSNSMQPIAGWLTITGKMVAESEVTVPPENILP